MRIQLSDHFTYKKLFRFTFPSIIMMIFSSLYVIVDGIFVTNFAGKQALAAINFVFPILNILATIGYMLGMGGSALVAKTLGEKNNDKANKLFSLFVYVSILLGVICSVAGAFILRPLMARLGADGEMLDKAVLYGIILLISLPFWNLQYMFQAFFVTAEKPKLGLLVTLIAGILNMFLDFLFIAVFKWDVLGAAVATALGQIAGGGIPLIYFFKKNNSLLHLGKTYFDIKALIKATTNGSSEFITGISGALVGLLYNTLLLKMAGEDGVAAYSIMMYVCFVFIGIFFGYANGTAPIVGYNYGAKNHKELKNLLKKGLIIINISALSMLVLSILTSEFLARIFAGYDKALYDMTLHGFRIYAISFFFTGLAVFTPSFFTALNNGLISGIISFFRTVIFQVGFVLILPNIFDLDGIWLSIVLAEMLSFIMSAIFIFAMRNKYHYA